MLKNALWSRMQQGKTQCYQAFQLFYAVYLSKKKLFKQQKCSFANNSICGSECDLCWVSLFQVRPLYQAKGHEYEYMFW